MGGVQHMSMVNVIDNTGARVAMVIRTLCGPKKPAGVGDSVVVVIKKTRAAPSTTRLNTKGQVKRAEVHRALMVRTRAQSTGYDGRKISFGDNACVLMTKKGEPLGTRFLSKTGALGELVNAKNCAKMAALAPQL